MRSILFLFLLVPALSSCKKLNDPNAHLNLKYGNDARHRLDVYLPEERDSSTAVVLLIHGGGWVAGNKTDWDADSRNYFLDRGYAVAAMNYRYACGDYTKQMDDIHDAITLIRSRVEEWEIGADRFALIGGSAGAHLSLLYAHAFDSDSVVRAVVSLVGPTDMTDGIFHQYAANYQIGYVFEQFFGVTYQENPQLYRDGSPIYRWGNVPTFFLVGALDDLVPPEQSIRMFDTLTVHGIAADTTVFHNAGHDLFGPGAVNRNQTFNEIELWLATYLVD
jgi:acetyl esterase/lipase